MDMLNYDMLNEIMCKLGVHDMINTMSVCKTFYNICKSQNLWRTLVNVDYANCRLFDNDHYVAYKICYVLNKMKKLLWIRCTFEQFYEMEEMYLLYGRITTVPSEIYHLINLQKLNLDSNELTIVPVELGKLTNLHTLYLCNSTIQ